MATVTLDLTPTPINLAFTQEDTFPFTFTMVDSAGAAINITGSSFVLTVDSEPYPASGAGVVFSVTESNTPGADGVVEFTPSSANLDQTPSTYFYDVQWTDGSSNVRTIIAGEFLIQGQITQ